MAQYPIRLLRKAILAARYSRALQRKDMATAVRSPRQGAPRRREAWVRDVPASRRESKEGVRIADANGARP